MTSALNSFNASSLAWRRKALPISSDSMQNPHIRGPCWMARAALSLRSIQLYLQRHTSQTLVPVY